LNQVKDVKMVDEHIIKPLLMDGGQSAKGVALIISTSAINEEKSLNKAIEELNTGNTLLLIDGEPLCYVINTSQIEI
jgi:spore germination protein KA